MARETFVNAVSCLAYILHFAGFACNAIDEVVALTSDILFTLILSLSFGAADSTCFV